MLLLSSWLPPLEPPGRAAWRVRQSASTWRALLLALAMAFLVAGARAQSPTPTAAPATAAPLPEPVVSLRPSTSALNEGGQVAIDVLLSRPLSTEVRVDFGVSASGESSVFSPSFVRLSPGIVRLRGGQTRGRVLLSVPEDSVLYDASQLLVVATGLSRGFVIGHAQATVGYRDNDAPRLFLRVNGGVIREGANQSRNLVGGEALIVAGSNLRPGGARLTLTSNRPDIINSTTLNFLEITGQVVSLRVAERPGLNPPVRVALRLSGSIMATDAPIPAVTATVVVVDRSAPFLSLRVLPLVVDEDSPTPARGVVARSGGDQTQALTVALRSSQPDTARVPSSVTIPAGSDRASFPIFPVERRAQEFIRGIPETGNRSLRVEIVAEAGLVAGARAPLFLRDTTPVIEMAASPDYLAEGSIGGSSGLAPTRGVVALKLARARQSDVPVALHSTDPRIVLGVPNVVLPRDGQAVRVPFFVRDDQVSAVGDRFSEARAFITAFDAFRRFPEFGQRAPAASVLVSITENDVPLLVRASRNRLLTIEGDRDVDITVARRVAGAAPLRVLLSLGAIMGPDLPGGPGDVTVSLPPSVTIPAGARSATVRARVTIGRVLFAARAPIEARAEDSPGGSETDGARATAVIEVSEPAPATVFDFNQESLSASAPTGSAILLRNPDAPAATYQIRAIQNAGLVSAPSTVRFGAGQRFATVPLRLRRVPGEDSVAVFRVVPLGAPPTAANFFAAMVHAEPPFPTPR